MRDCFYYQVKGEDVNNSTISISSFSVALLVVFMVIFWSHVTEVPNQSPVQRINGSVVVNTMTDLINSHTVTRQGFKLKWISMRMTRQRKTDGHPDRQWPTSNSVSPTQTGTIVGDFQGPRHEETSPTFLCSSKNPSVSWSGESVV